MGTVAEGPALDPAVYRALTEHATDLVMILEADGTVRYASPSCHRLLGYRPTELQGTSAFEYIHPDDVGHVREVFGAAMHADDNAPVRVQCRCRHASGSWRVMATTGSSHLADPIVRGFIASSHDVTEQVEAEEHLQETEAQYRSIFEATGDGLVIADLEGTVVEVNPAMCRMYGYTREEFVGRHVSLRKVAGGAPFQAQAINRRKDGTSFHVEGHSTTFTYRGTPHLLGVVRDITERVQAAEQLQETEAQYRSIFESSIDGLLISDVNSFIVEVNPAACQMYGYSHDELVGMNDTDLVHPDSTYLIDAFNQALDAGATFRTQLMNRRKDGAPFHVEVRATGFTYKGEPHVLSVVQDITERVQAEEQLRETEAQYRSIFEATNDGMVIVDLDDGRVVEANPAFCTLHGYTYDEVIGLRISALAQPDQGHVIARSFREIAEAGSAQTQVRGLRKDGSVVVLEAHGTALTYRGKPHILGVVRDITARVQAEAQLKEKEEQYRSIFNATSDGLSIVDFEGRIVEVNPAYCTMYGYPYEELIGLDASMLSHPDYQHILAEAFATIATGRSVQVQAMSLHKDGTPFHVEGHGSLFIYKGAPHVLGVVRDITERVEAQELLEQRVAERTRELFALLEVSHNVASTLDLQPLLGLILEQLNVVVEYSGAGIAVQDGNMVRIIAYRGPDSDELTLGPLPVAEAGRLWQLMRRSEPVIIADVRADTPEALIYRETVGDAVYTSLGYVRSWLGVPMRVKDRDIGSLFLEHSEPQSYTAHHAALALAIAQQAAIAMENARLYEQAQQLAVLEERQRLARELHDSVSQALYGIALGVRTAQLQREREPGRVGESLEFVLGLARTGLAEMRALIFELLPEALETEGLVAALEKQVGAVAARHGLAIEVTLGAEPGVPLAVKEAIYRIAQEALQNTVKHAGARRVGLRLEARAEELALEVRDDGAGFDTGGRFPGHLGLRTMRERATRLGGTLELESAPGAGTRICARIPSRTAG